MHGGGGGFGLINRGLKAPKAASFVDDGGPAIGELPPKLSRKKRRTDRIRLHREQVNDWRRELWFRVK